jgi:hypothetical protein
MYVKRHSVPRIYKAGSWDTLDLIVCNKCNIEKSKDNYQVYRYTCKACMALKSPITETESQVIDEPELNLDPVQTVEPIVRAKRKYKNGSWASLDVITCGKCDHEKPRDAFKVNRYVCMECSNAVLREHNKKKDTGKYSVLQKEYNAKYEATPHGQERRVKYREKVTQLARESAGEARRSPNIENRLRIYTRQRMEKTLGSKLTVAAALQYLGVSQPIFKSWIEHNFIDGMTWETLGTEWKPDLLEIGNTAIDERVKYDIFNWRNWAPTMNGGDVRDCRDRSVGFLGIKSG